MRILKMSLAEVEHKNMQLNEKVNEIIYDKVSQYREKTLEALKKPIKENVSPNQARRRMMVIAGGDQPESDHRLNKFLREDAAITRNALDEMHRQIRLQANQIRSRSPLE